MQLLPVVSSPTFTGVPVALCTAPSETVADATVVVLPSWDPPELLLLPQAEANNSNATAPANMARRGVLRTIEPDSIISGPPGFAERVSPSPELQVLSVTPKPGTDARGCIGQPAPRVAAAVSRAHAVSTLRRSSPSVQVRRLDFGAIRWGSGRPRVALNAA